MFNTKRYLVVFVLAAFVILAIVPAAAQEEITLVVWDTFVRPAEVAMMDQLSAQFEEANPGVTVQHEGYNFDDLMLVLPQSLSEEGGPDVAQINQGATSMGALVQAGLILPLDDYAAEYGWRDLYADSLHARNSFSADGLTYGEGNLYGISNTAEVVGVYYWKQAFADLGIEVPTTFAEFEGILQTIKDAGQTPIVFGSLDGWPAIHEYSAIEHPFSDPQNIDDFIFRREGATFVNDANLQAAQKLVEWVDAGYFPDGFEGMDYDNATLAAFRNREGVMWITGSWIAASLLEDANADEIGFFVIPSPDAETPPYAVGGVGIPYGISANSPNADLAAEFINMVSSPEVAAQLLELGFLPAVAVGEDQLTEGTLTTDIVNAWNLISSNNRVGHYLDWAVPLDDINAALQELMAKQITPEDFVTQVEDAYVAAAP